MATVMLSIALIVLAMVGLGAGFLLGRPPLKGSCGGLACVTGVDCAACVRTIGEAKRP